MNVRIIAAICSVFVSLFSPFEAKSDSIRMLDGTLHAGIILSSDASSVVIRTAEGDLSLLKAMMTLISFTTADRVVTTRPDTIECKIVSRQDTVYTAVTSLGPVIIYESTISQIRFNTGGELRVTQVPLTDSYFHSSPSLPGGRATRYYAAVSLGLHGITQAKPVYGNLYLTLPPNPISSTNGLLYTLEFGYYSSRALSFGLGYESFRSGKIQVPSGQAGTAGYDFFFMTAKFGGSLTATSSVFFYGSVDIGYFTIGYTEDPSFLVYGVRNSSEGIINLRLKVGTRFDVSDVVAYFIDLRLLTGDTSLQGGFDFRGLGASSGLEFHF